MLEEDQSKAMEEVHTKGDQEPLDQVMEDDVANEEKVKVVEDSLSKADWLSKTHLLSKASSSFSRWETLEEDKSKNCMPSAQSAHPARVLSLLALNSHSLSK
ncbi:hypothetical protein HKD37_03G006672 [Glycine soja]